MIMVPQATATEAPQGIVAAARAHLEREAAALNVWNVPGLASLALTERTSASAVAATVLPPPPALTPRQAAPLAQRATAVSQQAIPSPQAPPPLGECAIRLLPHAEGLWLRPRPARLERHALGGLAEALRSCIGGQGPGAQADPADEFDQALKNDVR